jgi:gluconate 2-dehydrogenase alpha chain
VSNEPAVEVVTIGAGWTANILAWKLTTAGHQVLSLEQGDNRWTYPDFAMDHDPEAYVIRKKMMIDITKVAWTWRPNPTMPSLPMRQYGAFHPGQGLGGSAVHWSGQIWRFLPTDFQYRTHTIERYGVDKLPEGSTIQDWPITYEDLEPYYDELEWDLGSSGQAGVIRGQAAPIPGGNPFEGPRTRDYPNPPLERNRASQMFWDACEALGYHPFPQPAGIASRAFVDRFGNERSACLYCGYCTRYGCEVDAKASGITTHLPVALATGRLQVRTGVRVIRIEVGGDGKATGVTYIDCDGSEHFQPAEVVVVSGYPLGNVQMLLNSRSQQHPGGVGNDRGQVGRNFTYQLAAAPVTGLWKKRRFGMYMGNVSTCNVIYDFNADNFDHHDVDFVGGSQIYSALGERDPISTFQRFDDVSSASGSGFVRDFARGWDSFVDINIQGESLPYVDQFMDLDPNYTDAWGQPLLRLTFDFHDNDRKVFAFVAKKAHEIMRVMNPDAITNYSSSLDPFRIDVYQTTHITGGAIMGVDPGDSVVNKYGQVWDTPNVFVTGACQYPQNPGANPTETLTSLAYMTGDAMTQRYFSSPGELLS